MSTHYQEIKLTLQNHPKKWLVTGAAGFIGSHLCESLLGLGQKVCGLDNFFSGSRKNLEWVKLRSNVDCSRFEFLEGDIRHYEDCLQATEGVDFVLHNAAVGSVPRSIEDPMTTHESNVDGFLNICLAAKKFGVHRLVYASSSSVYGDDPNLPKAEHQLGRCLSPYAVSKLSNELYGDVFCQHYPMTMVGLRYFNVFGPRQNPNGPYAAVIPRWLLTLLKGENTTIYGDGQTSRDFCYVANVVQANLLAAVTPMESSEHWIFNVAGGSKTSLNELHENILRSLKELDPNISQQAPTYKDFRRGDVRHSLASLEHIRNLLKYEPSHSVEDGIKETVRWFYQHHNEVEQ